jgi:hypothetical protein
VARRRRPQVEEPARVVRYCDHNGLCDPRILLRAEAVPRDLAAAAARARQEHTDDVELEYGGVDRWTKQSESK